MKVEKQDNQKIRETQEYQDFDYNNTLYSDFYAYFIQGLSNYHHFRNQLCHVYMIYMIDYVNQISEILDLTACTHGCVIMCVSVCFCKQLKYHNCSKLLYSM